MPAVVFVSILVSILFGQDSAQLSFTADFDILKGQFLLSLLIPFIAAVFDEVG